jgi:hypothetical protein
MRGWSTEEVAKWALTIDGITTTDTAILLNNKIRGVDLLERVTEDKLVRMYMMPGGPAGCIMSALAAIKSVEAAVPASMGESTRGEPWLHERCALGGDDNCCLNI